MSLSEQAVDVPLLPMNEQSLAIAAPVGRISSMSNCVARKVTGSAAGAKLRIEKRPGTTKLTTTTRDVHGGIGLALNNPSLATTLGETLVEVGGGIPYTYSPGGSEWLQCSSGPSVDTRILERRSLANANAVLYAPDVAAVGNVLCYTYISRDPTTSTRTALLTLVDGQGVQIRVPFAAAQVFRIKVVSDGTNFWVFTQPSTRDSTTIQVFDTTGAQLATSTINWGAALFSFDVHWDSAMGVWMASPVAANNLNMSKFTYAGGVITRAVNSTAVADATGGVGFLENTQGDSHTYVVGVQTAFNVIAYQMSTAGAIAHTYNVDLVNAVYVGNVTGFVINGSFDICVAYSLIQNTPPFSASFLARNNQTKIEVVAFGGGASALPIQRSLSLVSRAFVDTTGNWSMIMYYQSSACFSSVGTPVGPSDVSQFGAQPTYFVMSLAGSAAGGGGTFKAITGQFETGFAYYFMQSRNSLDLYPFHLSSTAVETQSTTASAGARHIPLGYLGEQQSLSVTIAGPTYNVVVAIAGIRDYVIYPVPGTAIQADQLLLPGLRATRYEGDTFVEDGFALAPEIVSVTVGAPGTGNLTDGEAYNVVTVYEWLDGAGDVVESATSQALAFTPAGGAGHSATYVIATDRTTSKAAARISVYRTFSPALTTTPGVLLRKIGEVQNDPTVDTVTFVDTLSDAAASLGQPIYSQFLDLSATPTLDYFPAPAFRNGCFFSQRAFAVGYDNALWVSNEKVDGHALTWSPQLRITLPKLDRMLSVVVMDTRIVIQCVRSVWSIPSGNFPNANLTSGTLPTPEEFPLTTGALGPAFSTPIGVVYAASSGIWSLDRSLASQYLGAAVQDETGANIAQITSAYVDKAQRIYLTLSTQGNIVGSEASTEVLVYDLITGIWSPWTLSTPPLLATVWQGQYTVLDTSGATWTLDDANTSSYTDNGASIPSSFTIAPIVLTYVNGYQSVWQAQFYGQWKGSHTLTIGVLYDGSGTVAESFPQTITSNPGVLRYEIMPKQPDCQEISFRFSDGSPAGNSFALETVTLLVGVEPGLGRIPPTTRRIPPV